MDALEADVHRFLQEHAHQYLDYLALLTTLRERHAGVDHRAFVSAVDGTLEALYQQHRFGTPGLKWAPSGSDWPKSIRGRLLKNADSILWDPSLQAYVLDTQVYNIESGTYVPDSPQRTWSSGLVFLPPRKLEPWHTRVSDETVYLLAFLLVMVGLYLGYR